MNRQSPSTLLAAVLALVLTGLVIWLIYLIFSGIGSVIPSWLGLTASVLIAVSAVGGPVWVLLRLSDRSWHRESKDRSRDSDTPEDTHGA